MRGYWSKCIEDAFDAAGITASKFQIVKVASIVSGAHDMYGKTTGKPYIPFPLQDEIKKLKSELKVECDRRICDECNGKGYFVAAVGSAHSANWDCRKCDGRGMI